MKTLRILSRVALFVGAIVLVLQTSPARAGDDDGALPNDLRRFEITFTKWVLTAGATPTFMKGFTGGAVKGLFVGETFVSVARTNPDIPSLSNLEVIYGVQADDLRHSFTALLRGGAALGKAQLDGRILAGWRTGAQVHVEWVRFASPSADCLWPPAEAGAFCFVGTITVEAQPGDEKE
jgi:hypothetical protein